ARDKPALRRLQLRKAINPGGVGTMGRGRVNHARGGITLQHGDSFARGVVRQAQDGNVRGTEHLFAQAGVAAFGFRNRDHLNVLTTGQTLANLQAGGAVFAIYEDFRFHVSASKLRIFSSGYLRRRNQYSNRLILCVRPIACVSSPPAVRDSTWPPWRPRWL